MTADSAATSLLTGLDGSRGWQEDLYRDLHRHPELSHQEERTAGMVADRLRRAGYDLHEQVGGTGVVGILRNGDGATVLLRADMDALPVREATGLPYASEATGTDPEGESVPVMHACGHDLHVAALAGAAQILADGRQQWAGTLIVVFQPGEETGDGARRMIDDGLAELIPAPQVALAQHVVPDRAGSISTRAGAAMSAADSLRITVYGRGAHGSMPQVAVDPVVLAAMIIVRLQTVVAREVAPQETAVLTVGSVQAGTKSNIIPDQATLLCNVRTYNEATRATVLAAIERIVRAECLASGSPREPEFQLFDRFPLLENDAAATTRVTAAFAAAFGDRVNPAPQATASEDFGDIPTALGIPSTYWFIGGTDAEKFDAADAAGRFAQDIPVNHSPAFAPVIQPTLDTATSALVVAALAWLAE